VLAAAVQIDLQYHRPAVGQLTDDGPPTQTARGNSPARILVAIPHSIQLPDHHLTVGLRRNGSRESEREKPEKG
jgi:hypothetical protein